MNRRDFLKSAVTATLGAASLTCMGGVVDILSAEEKCDLAVVKGSQASRVTETAVTALGGIGKFVSRGDVVVVKPNIGWDRRPEYAATTNPEVVSTLVTMCLNAGARKVKVFDRTVSDARRCYVQSGIADAARNAGAEVSFVDDGNFVFTDMNGFAVRKWPLYRDILEADKIINVPIAKTHGLSTLTLGMKNLMGIMGGWRSLIHQRLDGSLVDLTMAVKPVLTVIDAVRILTGNGPQGGLLSDVKKLDTVIASADPVAADAYGATLFGIKGENLEYLRIAERAGLGTLNLNTLTVKAVSL